MCVWLFVFIIMHIRWLLMMFYSEKYICICVCDENLFSIKKTHTTHTYIDENSINQYVTRVIQWRCIQDDVLTNFDYEFSILNNFWDLQKKRTENSKSIFFMSPLVASRYSFDSDRKNYEFTHTHIAKNSFQPPPPPTSS